MIEEIEDASEWNQHPKHSTAQPMMIQSIKRYILRTWWNPAKCFIKACTKETLLKAT